MIFVTYLLLVSLDEILLYSRLSFTIIGRVVGTDCIRICFPACGW